VRFNDTLNKFLLEYNAQPIDGVIYEQFNIIEKKEFFYVFSEDKSRIIWSGKTLREAKEFINSVNSGC